MPIERHRRRLANGEERVYTYAVSNDGADRRALSIRSDDSSVSDHCYRNTEKRRIVAALLANSSLLVVSEPGGGKTFLAEVVIDDLLSQGFAVAAPAIGTVKQMLLEIAGDLSIDTETIEGKTMTSQQLQDAIADWLLDNLAFLVLDNAHRFPVSLRCWLEKLHLQGQPMLLLATFPPARDIFLKLPRIELEPLSDRSIREIMQDEAAALGLELSTGQSADMQQRAVGNPMLARRVVREEYLGLEGNNYDHTQWIDGTPLLIAVLMCFMILRFLGLGFNNTSLYLLGGILTVAIGIVRLMIYSLPRQSNRLGR
ncbi:9-O-acetyl-N-acetylneuraminate esterase [Aphanothece hegewaldii CCALA 016]|uniref:9-O-acetyl-N-acetylneuraminate esterase n=1 Tax=Aphanothece hegewaldii CCALA 016 TaxID=2107694 RepID=A0A2T1LTD6_9CHRO|nr:ATP-binding protein [Aphanothece hegewaldii]PSF33909.1 9-O-acetyl-N-acetylneuraminate esterase [Aphanothece hegewaldii CCALA 016]